MCSSAHYIITEAGSGGGESTDKNTNSTQSMKSMSTLLQDLVTRFGNDELLLSPTQVKTLQDVLYDTALMRFKTLDYKDCINWSKLLFPLTHSNTSLHAAACRIYAMASAKIGKFHGRFFCH